VPLLLLPCSQSARPGGAFSRCLGGALSNPSIKKKKKKLQVLDYVGSDFSVELSSEYPFQHSGEAMGKKKHFTLKVAHAPVRFFFFFFFFFFFQVEDARSPSGCMSGDIKRTREASILKDTNEASIIIIIIIIIIILLIITGALRRLPPHAIRARRAASDQKAVSAHMGESGRARGRGWSARGGSAACRGCARARRCVIWPRSVNLLVDIWARVLRRWHDNPVHITTIF
jgi:hypothetical protein